MILFGIPALVLIAAFFGGYIMGHQSGTDAFRNEAIDNGAGHWKCDTHGKRTWHWKYV